MALVNYAIYVKAGYPTLIFRLNTGEGEVAPVGMETVPGKVVRYARSLEAWADARPLPPDGLPAEFFAGMSEVHPTGVTVAVDEVEAPRCTEPSAVEQPNATLWQRQ